ncbi:peroxide stress protein YaaA [Thiomicrorhabdus sp. 6S3-12]|uniref:peroxide stress protein YaaA n=1 Tax=Thiomicrorhabdus sp. 6S3-12 TaxID=2819681 RepID=UPI001AAC5140|nr:peroxide stress protein YaaA [Thiomicrorhabdus sp. 6S3-12]MBO1922896.1 peroxide stress protein YaaA [Thiomicrorhabdus sp. 6S3-12]
MLMLVSPAKSLDEKTPVQTATATQFQFAEEAKELIEQLQQLGPVEIGQLMSISEKLSELNYQRFQEWTYPFAEDRAKQSAWLFKGDVYQGLDAYSLDQESIDYLQKHLRILSGLYGLLKPCDLMLPYRLEMGTKFANHKGKDLYQFWGAKLSESLNRDLQAQGSKTIVNLASNEYFKAIDKKALNGRIITPIFKDWKGGKYKIISFHAKKARGLMARYAADHKLEEAEGLKYFDYQGYGFEPEMSNETDWVFTRKLEE